MKHSLFIFLVALTLSASGQTINSFDGRWCFTGSRISIFIVKENTLFFTLLEEHDTNQFSKFYSGGELGDSITLFPVTVDTNNDKFFLSTRLISNKKEKSLFFCV